MLDAVLEAVIDAALEVGIDAALEAGIDAALEAVCFSRSGLGGLAFEEEGIDELTESTPKYKGTEEHSSVIKPKKVI